MLTNSSKIDLGEYGVLGLFFGTCYIYKYPALTWVSMVGDLVQSLRAAHPHLSIVLSTILPRPGDFSQSDPRVKCFNQQLVYWGRGHGVPVLEPHRLFFEEKSGFKSVKGKLFYDGLHLRSNGDTKTNGAALLRNFFANKLETESALQALLRKAESAGRFPNFFKP